MRIRDMLLIVMSSVICSSNFADETDLRAQTLTGMRSRAHALRLRIGDQKERLQVGPQPLFRYNDPARTTTDGTLWLWTQDERPVAIACLFNDSREGFQWNYELVTLSDAALNVDGRPGWSWNPTGNVRRRLSISKPEPVESEALRLTQMKKLLGEIRAEETLEQEKVELRVLPRPIYRYRCEKDKIEDGALFLFAYGTNPEVVVDIQALSDHTWRIGFGRLTSAEVQVTHEGKLVWTAERVKQWNPKHEYFSYYGPDRDDAANRDDPKPKRPD